MPPGIPHSQSLIGPSRTGINDSQVANSRQEDRNTAQPQSRAMISAKNLRINGGSFIQNNYLEHDDYNVLKSLPRSRDAAFSAAINLDSHSRRPCTKGTRVTIITQIMAWVNEKDPAKAPPVYWLTGLAGLGKTTIAYTICELLNEAHLPFASFFCSLQLDSRDSKLLVTTLCRDLAEIYDSYAAHVLWTLETNSKVVDARLRIQIDELLAKPWQASAAQRNDFLPPIVVVDALDESDRGAQFLEELLRVIHVGQLAGIKFLVTSRPNPKIVDICKSFPPNAVFKLHEVQTADVQNDIEKYLQEALPELKDEPELALLSQRAGGWFIYATTAVRFICPPHNPPAVSEMRSHLQAMLNHGPWTANGDSQSSVDELYGRVLADAFQDARVRATRLRILHTIVCADSLVDISVLADLTNTDQDTVRRVVESLHAVIFVSSKDGCVYWYHASFPDFLFTQARAGSCRNGPTDKIDLFCDGSAHHRVLAQCCFSVMQESLHFNTCNLPSSYTFDCEVPGLNDSVDRMFSPTLRYVLRHWARHLLQAVPAENDNDDLSRGLKDFLDSKLLFWIEAMNLIGAKFECSALLRNADSWLKGGKEWPDLLNHLGDAINFSTFFASSPASKSTPHLYISALSMWNQDSPIWRTWRPLFAFIPSMLLPRASITMPLLTISTTCSITCIAFSPDGNRIVAGLVDNSVRVWDANTGEQLKELRGHIDWVTWVAFSPDGNQVASASVDNSIQMWDANTGERLRELLDHTDWASTEAVSPDGNRAADCFFNSVTIWNRKTGELLGKLQGHTDKVTSVSFSPDGNGIVSGSDDHSIRVWGAVTGEHPRELDGHTRNRTIYDFWENLVQMWDAMTGKKLREPHGHGDTVSSVTFSPDGNRIASGSFDGSVKVWDAETGEQLREIRGNAKCVTSVAISPDGNRIVSVSHGHSMQVWDSKTGKHLREIQGDAGCVIAFSPDGNQIVPGFHDRSIRIWNAMTGEQPTELGGRTINVSSVTALAGNEIISYLWKNLVQAEQAHTSIVCSVIFSPDGNRIASGFCNGSVRVWDARERHTDLASHIVSALEDKSAQDARNEHGHISHIASHVTSVAFSPDGNRIVAGSIDKSTQLWYSNQHRLLRGPKPASSVSFSPDGNQIVIPSWSTVRMWDAKTGKLLRELRGHTSDNLVTFSSKGDQIGTGPDDKSVLVWDAKTGKQLRELCGHIDWVTSAAFSPDGDQIVSASHDKLVCVWDAKTGQRLRELRGHTDWITSVAFSPDGHRIVSGSEDRSLRVWTDLNIDAPWVLKDDGWVLSGTERLVWVPSTICKFLLRPHNVLTISRDGSASISFEECRLGTSWHGCYTP